MQQEKVFPKPIQLAGAETDLFRYNKNAESIRSERRWKAAMRRIVLDMKGGLLAEAVMQALTGCDPDFVVYRSLKPEETVSLCRACHANVLVMEVIRQGVWKLSERLKIQSDVKKLGWDCKTLLLVDENADEMLAADVRQAVKDRLVDNFIYASVSPTYLAGVIDTL